MSEYAHDEHNDYAAHAPSETSRENPDRDSQAPDADELEDLAVPGEDETDTDLDALDSDWEDDTAAVNGSSAKNGDHRITHVRRAIERHQERMALRAMLADGYDDAWDEFDSRGTGH